MTTLRAAAVLACLTLTPPPAGAARPPCASEFYRQFDFWVGDWDVADPEGKAQGTNRIESILDGCALHESWRGTGGSVGHSYNAYDRSTGKWSQTWIDNGGSVLRIEGGWVDGAMVLEGPGRGRDGTEVVHRVSWAPLADGRVRQHWQSSVDGGATWNDVFVGLYTRRGGK